MRWVAPVAGIIALSACAPTPYVETARTASEPTQCFRAESVRTYVLVERDAMIIRAGRGETYRLDLLSPCIDLEWAREVAFRGRGGQSFVCSSFDAEVVVSREAGRPETCLVSDMTQISAPEAAALAPGPVRFFRPWRPERRWPPLLRRPRTVPDAAEQPSPMSGP